MCPAVSRPSPIGGVVGHAGEHFGDVTGYSPAALALQLAGHVHQAAEVAGEQRVRAGRRDVGGLLLDDRIGDVRILDAEGAAETAADVGVAAAP